MQRKPIAVGEPPGGSARGLGVCDALEVPIKPFQLMWLIDELYEMQGPLERQEQRCRESTSPPVESDESAEDAAYQLAVLRAMASRLPKAPGDAPVALVGPSGFVLTAVRGATRSVTAALSEIAAQQGPVDESARELLQTYARAAVAWVETLVDCATVVGFNFDSDADPSQAL
jgi:hypothetical protein